MTRDYSGCYLVVGLPGPWAKAISACTGSWANHSGIIIPGGWVVEPWLPRARLRPLAAYESYRTGISNEGTRAQRLKVSEFAQAAVGKPYDVLHFAAFTASHLLRWDVLERLPLSNYAMLCSRFVVLAGAAAGLDWTGGQHPHRVTPGMLASRLEKVAA